MFYQDMKFIWWLGGFDFDRDKCGQVYMRYTCEEPIQT